jgi:glycine/D-amino acid oxidase-like deaminating enzyme
VDLKSGCPYWQIRNGLVAAYPALGADLECDVAIIGGGVTGALVAFHLVEAGASVVVLDGREMGWGSTSATTALLQYELDVSLDELGTLIGPDAAAECYRAAREGVERVAAIAESLPDPCGFARRSSVYLAGRTRDVPALAREQARRVAAGFDVELWDRREVEHRFPFTRPAALFTRDAAEVDPYRLTHALLATAAKSGLRAHDRTVVSSIDLERAGPLPVRLGTDRGHHVDARRVVFATGYETEQRLRQPSVKLRSTYALASEPLGAGRPWYERALIWETTRPYLYLRTTDDGRVIVGGEDDSFASPARRDRALPKKTARLIARFAALFPDIPIETAFAWAGTFAETADGLPFIGAHRDYPNAWFAACYGGNGVPFGAVAGELIRDLWLGRANSRSTLFRFGR